MNKIIIIVLSILILPQLAKGEATIASADSAYQAGNYIEAIDEYTSIMEEKGVSAPLLFNLGNSYLKEGDFGQAMLCYQRAKKLDPSNKRITSNLNYVKEKVEDANKAAQKGKRKKVTEDTPNFFQSVHSSISENHSSNSWAGWAVAFFLIFAVCAALYLFTVNVLVRKFGFFGGIVSIGLSMLFLVFAYTAAASDNNREYGIVVAYKIALQIEPKNPSEESEGEGVLTRGTRVRIVTEETDAEGNIGWYKVRLNSDYIGWLPSDDIEII